METVLIVALFFYPLIGLALLVLFSSRFSAYGPMSRRVLVAAVVASISTLLFTPIVWGSDSFGFITPWVFMLFNAARSKFHWSSPVATFALSFLVNLVSGRASLGAKGRVRGA